MYECLCACDRLEATSVEDEEKAKHWTLNYNTGPTICKCQASKSPLDQDHISQPKRMS